MFTIGEFSRLGHVSARMLRHYDQIGLLRPTHTGAENGYRYYDPAQLPVLAQIETLKGYGFSLREIAELLPLSPPELGQRLHVRRLGAYRQLQEMREALRRLEDDISKMEGISLSLDKYHVIVMQNPAQTVYSIRRRIDIGEVPQLFADLLRQAAERGLTRTGPTQQIYHGQEFSYQDMDIEAQVEVCGNAPGVRELPACLCAATTHVGPYDTVRYAYEAVGAWLQDHPEYRICGPAIERYLKDHGDVDEPHRLETGILFPVEQVDR